MDYTLKIGGAAGQGTQTIGDALTRVFARCGYHVFSHQDYESRIRGGHNFYQIRFSDKQIMSSRTGINIIIALHDETIIRHAHELSNGGRIIYDSEALKIKHEDPHFLDVPFSQLALQQGGSKIMENTVATGAVLGILGINPDLLFDIIRDFFAKKGRDVIDANIRAASAGYEYTVKNCTGCSYSLAPNSDAKMLINGSDSIAAGALVSGMKFYAAYPMTPSTGIMNFIAAKATDFGIIVEQAEDEIAAINMAIGASFGGVRSMTATSGGGFALMVEGLSLAGMTETPVVIGLGQRPGPATGFPTRTEQADLLFAINAAHGEFPKVLLAPGTPEQAFFLTNKAFDLAEKYQIAVIILFDTYLTDSQWTYDNFYLGKITYTDYRLRGEAFSKLGEYKRHAFTDSGISPLGVPGQSHRVVVTDSDEHDEDGHIVEDAETRIKMVDKRLFKKLTDIRREMEPPLHYGSGRPEIVLVGWGSTFGVIKEAVDILSKQHNIAMLHFSDIHPLPDTSKFDYLRMLWNASKTICVENNATGQFARFFRSETGYAFSRFVNRFDGRPFMLEELIGEINGILGRI